MGIVIRYVSWVGILAHAAFIGLFLWLRVPVMAAFNVGSVAIWIGARMANTRLMPRVATWLIFGEVTAHAILAVGILGWASGFHYYLIPLIPFLMFNDQLRTRTATAGSVLVALVYAGLRALTFSKTAGWIAPVTMHAVAYLNLFVPFVALGLMSAYFRYASVDVERQMAELAMTDMLTGLPNRRRMRELLDGQVVRFQRSAQPFGVLLSDIDGFKAVNDSRGHACGDYVLRELAGVLRSRIRGQDSVARWGGEEFLFLLPETDAAGSTALAEKLRSAVERAGMSFGGAPVSVTMTFGVAAFDGKGSLEDAIRQADQALYMGKERGKNRVVAVGTE